MSKSEVSKIELFLFGAGQRGVEIKRMLNNGGLNIAGFIDNNPDRISEVWQDSKIYSLEQLKDRSKEHVFIIVSVETVHAREGIKNQLLEAGYERGKDFVLWSELIEKVESGAFHLLGSNRNFNMYQELEKMYRQFVFPDLEITSDQDTFRLIYNLIGTNDGEAIYIRYYLKQALKAPGDVCEFGIAQGATSALLANDIKGYDRKLWLFDSFEGLSVPTQEDELKDDIFNYGNMAKYAFSMKCNVAEVKERLKKGNIDEASVEIVPGFIQDSIQDKALEKLKKVCFAYIDFDLYEPIAIALDFLHERTEEGSVIIVDDYDFFSTGAKTAVDRFIEKHKQAGIYSFSKPIESAGHFCIIERIK